MKHGFVVKIRRKIKIDIVTEPIVFHFGLDRKAIGSWPQGTENDRAQTSDNRSTEFGYVGGKR